MNHFFYLVQYKLEDGTSYAEAQRVSDSANLLKAFSDAYAVNPCKTLKDAQRKAEALNERWTEARARATQGGLNE